MSAYPTIAWQYCRGNLLGCKLTTKKVARDPADLERHIHGHRFQRALTVENERSRASELVESMEMEFESPKEEDDADQSELVDERPIEEPAKKSMWTGSRSNKSITSKFQVARRGRSVLRAIRNRRVCLPPLRDRRSERDRRVLWSTLITDASIRR